MVNSRNTEHTHAVASRGQLKCDATRAETRFRLSAKRTSPFNILTPNANYSGRTAPLTSKVAFYIFIQQIQILNIFNISIYSPFFSLQNAVCFIILTLFGFCIIHILYTGVLKFKKYFRRQKVKSVGGRQFSRLLAAEVCASAVVMLDTPFSEVV